MKVITPLCLLFMGLFLSFQDAGADVSQIRNLLKVKGELNQLRQALSDRRIRLSNDADSLSTCIDSLKQIAEPAATQLHEALRASLILVARLVEVDQRLHNLEAEAQGVCEELRLAYDWEIAQLIEYLSHQAEREALLQLMVYQQAREALGEDVTPANLRYGEDMDISQEDGPDEIAQKIELLEDSLLRLQVESKKIEKRLRRLGDERRLRAQVKVFTNQITLFDENLSQGRVLRQGIAIEINEVVEVRSGVNVKADGLLVAEPKTESSPTLTLGLDTEMANASLRSQSQTRREGNDLARMRFGSDELILEISKLKSKQSEIRQLEAVLKERIGVFHQQLQAMLGEQD